MLKSSLALLACIIALCFSGSSYALDFIKFGTSHDGGFWGTPDPDFGVPSTVQYLEQRGKTEITSLELTDQNVGAVFTGKFGQFNAIVVSESIQSLSPSAYALFNDFVSSGGCLIITGDHASGEDEFLDNVFGFSVGVTDSSDPSDTYSIQPGASGTPFGGGPALLISEDLTTAYSNTPGSIIYSGPLGVAVFTTEFDLGVVTAIGWDYCCDSDEDPNAVLDWYNVVDRAFDLCNPDFVFTRSLNIPTLSEWGLIAMAGVLGLFGLFVAIRRKRVSA